MYVTWNIVLPLAGIVSSLAIVRDDAAAVRRTCSASPEIFSTAMEPTIVVIDPATIVHSDNGKATTSTLAKRDNVVKRNRHVTITYTCPVGGEHSREFRWEVDYNWTKGEFGLLPIQNIASFDHVIHSTNDFASAFNDRRCIAAGEQCCTQIYKGTFGGTIFTTHLDMDISEMQVSEECIEQPAHPVCPAPGAAPPIVRRNCAISELHSS